MMTKKNDTQPVPEIVVQPDDILSAEVEIIPFKPAFEGDMLDRIIQYAGAHGSLSEKTAVALDIINSGIYPPEVIQTRQGGGGKDIPYINHVYATRLMNAAFGFLWDYECLKWEVFPDGSVAADVKMTVNLPLGIINGQAMFYRRTITEIGSFEAYVKTKQTDPNSRKYETVISEVTGKPEFTMNTADRVASAVSRGLPKAMLRGFNLGSNLYDAPSHEVTPESVWKSLVNTAARVGLTRDEAKDLMVANGFKGEQLPKRYKEAYKIIVDNGKKKIQETVDF